MQDFLAIIAQEGGMKLLSRIPSGVPGFDEVLHGGLIPGRLYLLSGGPGVGKTTLGLCFLREGVRQGERALCISLSEPVANLVENATSLGIDVAGIDFLDLAPTRDFFVQVETYDLFSPADVERVPTTRRIVESVTRVRPKRVFVDSLSQFRYLAPNPFEYRKQVLSFVRFLTECGATVLATSEGSSEAPDADLQFLADGVFFLFRTRYGRGIEVKKFRGSSFEPGVHALELGAGGVRVFPYVVPLKERVESSFERLSSGIPELDALCGGGIEEGTTTIITGPTGVGKTTLAFQFAWGAAQRGRRIAVYSFEEDVETILFRCEQVGIPAERMVRNGFLVVQKIVPFQYSFQSFGRKVIGEVFEREVLLVIIDSIAGYKLSILGQHLEGELYFLVKYLNAFGRTVFLINELERVTGDFEITGRGLSYLADNIIFLRYLEIRGELRKAIGILKKRLGDFEKRLREFSITEKGIVIGPPLGNLRGILLGVPEWVEE
ncbi:MAG: AAA family ATPase [Candidatus Caldatribacterium sp.]|nr:AAA family ATPase [Candidatus Caldatribacterium sp.]